ncbi:MAG: hypothetical protein ABI572_11165 [Actinomycetota bacterium]
MPVRVEADGTGRYPAETEATVYFCTLEAPQNVAKYAEPEQVTVSLAPRDGPIHREGLIIGCCRRNVSPIASDSATPTGEDAP